MRRLLVVLAACGDSNVLVQPVYDLPAAGDDASPDGIDSLTLAVAREGEATDLVSLSFAPGAAVELANVPFVDDLVIHLTGRAGGAEVAYGRSCGFAISPDEPPPEPHVFFSRTVKFASTGFASSRTFGIGLTDESGAAVLLGGIGDGTALRTVERFDPRTGELAVIAQLDGRAGTVGALLGSGAASQVGVFGGTGTRTLELVSSDGRIERVDDSESALTRTDTTATTLTDGRIAVIGGRRENALVSGVATITREGSSVEIRTLNTGLLLPREKHTATRLGDDVGAPVLIAGGIDIDGAPVRAAELFKPLSNSIPATFRPEMRHARSRHTARLLPDNSVLIIGGLDQSGQPVRQLERFTIDAGFADAGELPGTAGVIEMSVTELPDGQLLLAGGRLSTIGSPVADAFLARLDLVSGQVEIITTDRLAEARAGHQAALLCDGTVLIAGGTVTASAIERYNPPAINRR